MYLHDTLKIIYTRNGYLPDYPYHSISDNELMDAFINTAGDSYFYDNYPCEFEEFRDKYDTLVSAIKLHVDRFKENNSYVIPDWVYSYMIPGATIGPASDLRDRHDLFVLLNMDNQDDLFTIDIYSAIYDISNSWVSKLPSSETRPATIFGEPHIIKSLRVSQIEV